MAAIIGTGTTISSADEADLALFAATTITFANRTVNEIPIPALNTPAGPIPKLYGDLYDPGNLTVAGYLDTLRDFDPGTPLGVTTITLRQAPGEATPATYIGDAILMSEGKAVPVEDVCTQELGIGWTAGYAYTAATAV